MVVEITFTQRACVRGKFCSVIPGRERSERTRNDVISTYEWGDHGRSPHPETASSRANGYFRPCVGSFTSLTVSNSTLTIWPPTFSTLRI